MVFSISLALPSALSDKCPYAQHPILNIKKEKINFGVIAKLFMAQRWYSQAQNPDTAT